MSTSWSPDDDLLDAAACPLAPARERRAGGVPVDLIVRGYAVYVVPGGLDLRDAAACPMAPARVRRVD